MAAPIKTWASKQAMRESLKAGLPGSHSQASAETIGERSKWAGKGTSANDFPASIKFQGKTFGRTGKIGHRVSDGTPTAEYRNYGASGHEGERVWHGLDGKTMPD